ncbi:MAG TPA: hypothetical protein ENK12_02830 [Gammaproteobacteria bacterium]|nr:hypothetical protein [Gammaproteobacteria bacterium]
MNMPKRTLTCLAAGLVLLLQGLPARADDDANIAGTLVEINRDAREIRVGQRYYRLDRNTVVHAPDERGYLNLDDLSPGTSVGIRTDRPAAGDVLPRAMEVWIYLD